VRVGEERGLVEADLLVLEKEAARAALRLRRALEENRL
jgi:hypothetical protein